MRNLMCAVAFVLLGAVMATAEDPMPVRPAPPPVQPRPVMVTAARMLVLEEEFETADALREVAVAQVKLTEVAIIRVKLEFDRAKRINSQGLISKSEIDKAQVNVNFALAQLAIRKAELKVAEVKVKYAKKRLDNAKAAGVRPATKSPMDPLPPDGFRIVPEPTAAELKAKIETLQVAAEKKKGEAKKAEAELKAAQAGLDRIREVAKRGRVRAGTIEAAEAKVAEATKVVETITKERKAQDDEIATLKAKLKEIEK